MLAHEPAMPMECSSDSQQANPIQWRRLMIYAGVFMVPMLCGLVVALVLPQYGLALKFGGSGHDGYLELARSLYNGEGYRFSTDGPTALHRLPLYPTLLVPFMGLELNDIKVAVVLLNSLFLLIACIYTRRICELLFPQAAIGTIAMVLLVSNPWTIRLISSPLSAVMQMALYAGLSFYFLRFCDQLPQFGQRRLLSLLPGFLGFGVLSAALCYTHGTGVYVCAILLMAASALCLLQRQWKVLCLVGISALFGVLALSPLVLHNQQQLQRLELSSSGAGFTYFLGNNYWGIGIGDYREDSSLSANALRMAGIESATEEHIAYWGITDPELDQRMRDAMVKHMVDNPTEVVKKSLLNLADILFPITHAAFCQAGNYSQYCQESLDPYQLGTRATRSLLMLLIVGMAISALRHNRGPKPHLAWIALAGAGLHLLPYLPIATYAHHGIYAMGTLPLLCALAAASLYRIRVKKALLSATPYPQRIWYKAPALTGSELEKRIRYSTSQAIEAKRPDQPIDHIIG